MKTLKELSENLIYERANVTKSEPIGKTAVDDGYGNVQTVYHRHRYTVEIPAINKFSPLTIIVVVDDGEELFDDGTNSVENSLIHWFCDGIDEDDYITGNSFVGMAEVVEKVKDAFSAALERYRDDLPANERGPWRSRAAWVTHDNYIDAVDEAENGASVYDRFGRRFRIDKGESME